MPQPAGGDTAPPLHTPLPFSLQSPTGKGSTSDLIPNLERRLTNQLLVQLARPAYNEGTEIECQGVIVTGQKILLLDDEEATLRMLELTLAPLGYNILKTGNSQDALRQMYEQRPDLAILDINLQGDKMDGLTVCGRIREVSEIPIVMLTANKEPEDIVMGLEAGADDYVTKPFNKEVLIARVKANLRRAGKEPTFERSGVTYGDGFLTVNVDERRVLRDGENVKLSPTEFNLLVKLIESSPRVVAYRDLLQSVWGYEYMDDIDYLRVYIWHLRRKIEPEPKDPVYLVNELGVGYRFEKQV